MNGRDPARQLILLVDALGWLTVERTGFLADLLPHRRRLATVFGYSSTAVPSLLTGAMPVEHGHWFLFRRARERFPFRAAAWVDRLPGGWGRRWRVRSRLQEYWRKKANIQGYFSLYNVPFRVLAGLEPVEMQDTWAPGAFPATPSLVDALVRRGDSYFLSDWRRPDAENLDAAFSACSPAAPRTVCLYLTGIDGLQHRVGTRHADLDAGLAALEGRLRELVARLEAQGPLGISLFSDHGMTDVTGSRDLIAELQGEGLRRHRDYEAFFDSTVARFWDVRDPAALARSLGSRDWGRLLDEATLAGWGVDFPGREYGDVVFLADPGLLILPSDMGEAPLAAMHGYDPADPTSDACLLTDRPVELAQDHITAVLPMLERRWEEGS